MDKPRPKTIIPDNAKSLVAQKLTEFMADLWRGAREDETEEPYA